MKPRKPKQYTRSPETIARIKRAVRRHHGGHPMEQGSLREIWDRFFAPLVVYKPTDMSLAEWLESLFDINNRTITQYRAQYAFRMPGLLYVAPTKPIQGIGRRNVPAGKVLWVRADKVTGNVDVEFASGKRRQVFQLTESQWGYVKLQLETVSPCPNS